MGVASPSLVWMANRFNALRIENVVGGSAIDVSGWTWTGQLRPSVDGTPVITMDVDMSEAADGAVTLSIDAADCADLADQVWSIGVDVVIDTQRSQIIKSNLVKFEEPVEPVEP